MYLGQLQAGAAAVHSFQTGIDLMLAHKAQLSKSKVCYLALNSLG
jgi:hypothetical protein